MIYSSEEIKSKNPFVWNTEDIERNTIIFENCVGIYEKQKEKRN